VIDGKCQAGKEDKGNAHTFNKRMKFEVLSEVPIKIQVIWDMMPCTHAIKICRVFVIYPQSFLTSELDVMSINVHVPATLHLGNEPVLPEDAMRVPYLA
jgi:hypothetical protein